MKNVLSKTFAFFLAIATIFALGVSPASAWEKSGTWSTKVTVDYGGGGVGEGTIPDWGKGNTSSYGENKFSSKVGIGEFISDDPNCSNCEIDYISSKFTGFGKHGSFAEHSGGYGSKSETSAAGGMFYESVIERFKKK